MRARTPLWAWSTPTRMPSTTKIMAPVRDRRARRSAIRPCTASTGDRRATTKSTTCRYGPSTALPFGPGQMWMNHGLVGEIIGGWQLNGQFSHYSGFPFSVSANSNTIGGFTPGFGATYAQLVPISRRAATSGRLATPTFLAASRGSTRPHSSSPTETAAAPVLPNTGRNQFRGPGNSQINAQPLQVIQDLPRSRVPGSASRPLTCLTIRSSTTPTRRSAAGHLVTSQASARRTRKHWARARCSLADG